MKKKHKSKPLACDKKRDRPTLLEFLAGVHQEANKQFEVPLEITDTVRPTPLPEWGKQIVSKFGKTILKPLHKLRPSPNKVNIQNFGKSVGVISFGITFFRIEVHKIEEAEGLDKISPEQWEEIQPSVQMRAYVIKKLGRPVGQTERLEDLQNEAVEKQIKQWEEMRSQAFLLMSQRSRKENALFNKGFTQGYELLMDEDGNFAW